MNCSVDTLDHADLLRGLYKEISATVDAQSVARNMFQCNALTLKELQSIQSNHQKPVKAASKLLDIVMKQSGNVYSCFLESLKATGHQHVYENVIAGSCRGTLMCYYWQYSQSTRRICVKHLLRVISRFYAHRETMYRSQQNSECTSPCQVL